MKKEDSPEGSMPKESSFEGQKISLDDLKFMRSAVEKTYRQVKPVTHVVIMWGLICIITYATIHFMAASHLHKWIPSVGWPLVAIGLCYTFIAWLRIAKREKGI